MRREIHQINEIIIHCTATPNGRFTTAEDVNRWHKDRGFKRDPVLIGYNQPSLKHIGYHYLIYSTGSVVIGRGLKEVGAHCRGHNRYSIGVSMVGTDQFHRTQWRVLSKLVAGLKNDILTIKTVSGHNQYNKQKACPCFDVQAWLAGGMRALEGHILKDEE